MDFDFTPEEQAFRTQVQSFLAKNLHEPMSEYDPEFLEAWDHKVAEQGWLGFSWPKDMGGAGASLIEQFILKEEMSAARAPRLGRDFMGITWVGPGNYQPWNRRAERAVPAGIPFRRISLVHGLFRTRERKRPRVAQHPGHSRWR